MRIKKELLSLSPLRISIIYLVVACLWILFTDRILESVVTDVSQMSLLQTYKGWFYMIFTSVGLYFFIKKQNEEEKELFKERSQFIEAILENIPLGIAVNNIDDGKMTLMNDQFSSVYGWPVEIVKDVDTFFLNVYQDEEFRQEIRKKIMVDIASGNQDRMQWDRIPIDTKNHEKRYVNAKNISLPDQNLMISTVVDVTERVMAEQEIKKSEELYRYLFHKNPQPMWIFELETLRFLEVNYAAVKQYGYSKKEFLRMKIIDIRPIYERLKLEAEIQKLNKNEDNSKNEWIHLKKNGDRITVNTYGTAIEYEGKSARLVLINDVTQKNRNQELLIEAAILGEDRERKRIAQELHDGIGQYLSAVNLNMESLKKEVSSFSEKKKNRFLTSLKFVKKAMNETRTMAYALMPAELEELGLYAALNTLAKEIEESAEVKVILEEKADESTFEIKMISNLYRIAQEGIKNAIEHGKASEIKLKFEESEGQLHFIISDNGIGIDPDKINTSSGIGIRSINARAEAMAGEVKMTGNKGAGYKIQINVPINGSHK